MLAAHCRSSGPTTLPQGSSLRSGLFCPGPSSLTRPHPPLLRAHCDFVCWTYTQCLRCAGAPRRPPRGSVLSLLVLVGMSSSPTPGSPPAVYPVSCWPAALAFTLIGRARHFRLPHKSVSCGIVFSRLNQFTCATTCRLARLPDGPDRPLGGPAYGDFYTRASDGLVTRPVAEYHYRANWAIYAGRTFTYWTVS